MTGPLPPNEGAQLAPSNSQAIETARKRFIQRAQTEFERSISVAGEDVRTLSRRTTFTFWLLGTAALFAVLLAIASIFLLAIDLTLAGSISSGFSLLSGVGTVPARRLDKEVRKDLAEARLKEKEERRLSQTVFLALITEGQPADSSAIHELTKKMINGMEEP